VNIESGFQAIQQSIGGPWETRFLQSIKAITASPRFTGTPIFAPDSISMSRDSPFHMTILPGGGSLAGVDYRLV
jgi:hypothetical protein